MALTMRNGPLYAVVAAVAVAAVVAGGVIAAGQGPQPRAGGPAPAPLPATTAAPTGASTPAPTPSGTPTAVVPKKVQLALSKLPRGREPQLTYVRGRQVVGGAGEAVTIPGDQQIVEAGRFGNQVLAILVKDAGTEMARINFGGELSDRIPDVSSLVVSQDGRSAAYATIRTTSGGGRVKGGVVYLESQDAYTGEDVKPQVLKRPDDWDLRVLTTIDDTVFFRASGAETASTWSLYSWKAGASTATRLKTVGSPTALAANATVAASLNAASDTGSCSSVTTVATGKRNWRTCDYSVVGFTPDGSTAIGAPSSRDGYADGLAAALDATNGNLVNEWTGLSFRDTVAEDDGHLLLLVDDGPETKAAIIRCTIGTGACELATTPARTELIFGS